jgi:DNA-binding transcriptional LysR family regulator
MARAGLGIAVVQKPIGRSDPKLQAVLPDVTLASIETWIVTHENLRHVPRVRAVFDHLVEAFLAYTA